jgi:hypothetical protein
MLQPLGVGLNKTKKSKLWFEAMTYSSLVGLIETEIPKNYPDFKDEFTNLKVSCKSDKDKLSIKLVSPNLPFLSWLKTELVPISNLIKTKFIEKKLLEPNQEITITCLGR